jgi:hypothetical protein
MSFGGVLSGEIFCSEGPLIEVIVDVRKGVGGGDVNARVWMYFVTSCNVGA